MSNKEILGTILVLFPFILLLSYPLVLFIAHWIDAIDEYKKYGYTKGLKIVITMSIFLAMILTGFYLIISK